MFYEGRNLEWTHKAAELSVAVPCRRMYQIHAVSVEIDALGLEPKDIHSKIRPSVYFSSWRIRIHQWTCKNRVNSSKGRSSTRVRVSMGSAVFQSQGCRQSTRVGAMDLANTLAECFPALIPCLNHIVASD